MPSEVPETTISTAANPEAANNNIMMDSSAERRGSTSSEGSSTSNARNLSTENSEYLQATRSRSSMAAAPKPAANPLQFIKVGPCDLYRSAQEQLKRAQEVRNNQELKKEDREDWQSNLDNWKSSRRKRVEHIIERCVEVKKFEEEEHERAKRRSKTFSQMMEDRAGRRNGRVPIPIYCEEDNNDLSDLGIGTSSTSGKSSLSEDCDNNSVTSEGLDLDKNHSDLETLSSSDNGNRKNGSSANEYDTCTTATISSPEPEEYTYEGAIQNYKSRIITQTSKMNGKVNDITNKEKSPDKQINLQNYRRTSIGSKIENKLSSFEQRRASNTDLSSPDGVRKDLPKVDISKKRELFEKETSPENGNAKSFTVRSPDALNAKSIKERLSHLEKITDDSVTQNKQNVLPIEVCSLKDRLSSLEKHTNGIEKPITRVSNGDVSNMPSVRDRMSSLKAQTIEEKTNGIAKEKIVLPEKRFDNKVRLNGFDDSEFKDDSSLDSHLTNISSERNSSPESGLFDTKRFHRSLDSLDTDDNMTIEKFDRIQSSEDICGDSGMGIDTDREDSGIHTEDVSRAVSQADEPEPTSFALLRSSTNSQDTVIHLEAISPVPDADDSSSKDEYFPVLSHADDDPPTAEDFFDREEEDTVKSLDPDNSIDDLLDEEFKKLDELEQIKSTTMDQDFKMPEPLPTVKIIEESCNRKQLVDIMKENCEEIKVSPVVPLYENIDLLYQTTNLSETQNGFDFALGAPVMAKEPPKEKPPPPPVDDDEANPPPMKRLNSTKRIKKEIRNKRSSFLGIEGNEDDSYLDPELKLAPRPDITSFLQEESRVEKMLYRKSLYYDSDSNLGESRDSGVELERGHSDDIWSNKQASPDVMSEQHSRQGSEPFTNTSVTSEEDEIHKNFNIINATKNEDMIRENVYHSEQRNSIGEQLTSKLKELEEDTYSDKEYPLCEAEKNKLNEDSRMKNLEDQIREQQINDLNQRCNDSYEERDAEEVLRVERELLQLEQEELKRQRDNLLFRENQARKLNGRSLQDINMAQSYPAPVNNPQMYSYANPTPANLNYRQSMPDLAMKQSEFAIYNNVNNTNGIVMNNDIKQIPISHPIKKLPPPIPPVKPIRSAEMKERDISVRNSRTPSASADYVNIDHESGVVLRQKTVPPASDSHHQMSRHTLQALSAAPRSRLIPSADWLQPKRRSEPPAATTITYNHQHWLVQEAEQRRIDQLRSNIKKQQTNGTQAGSRAKHLPEAVIQTLTQRVQNMNSRPPPPVLPPTPPKLHQTTPLPHIPQADPPEKMLSVSGKRKCSHCGEELGRGAAMIIESLRLFYHLSCFQCCVCGVRLGDGRLGADVRVRHNQLHCHNCYSSDDGVKFSCV